MISEPSTASDCKTVSGASDVPGGKSISNFQVYVWDRTTGILTLASKADDSATTGNLGGNAASGGLSISTLSISSATQSINGTVIAFDSSAGDLDPRGEHAHVDRSGRRGQRERPVAEARRRLQSGCGIRRPARSAQWLSALSDGLR